MHDRPARLARALRANASSRVTRLGSPPHSGHDSRGTDHDGAIAHVGDGDGKSDEESRPRLGAAVTVTGDADTETASTSAEVAAPRPQRVRSMRIDKQAVGLGIGLLIVAIVLPVFPAGGFTDSWVGQLAAAPVFAIAILSLVVLARATASISLCQAAFMGVSAYAFSYLSISPESGGLGWSLLPAAVVGVVIVAPVGMGIAFPALRMRGIELALLTLTVGAALNGLIFTADAPLVVLRHVGRRSPRSSRDRSASTSPTRTRSTTSPSSSPRSCSASWDWCSSRRSVRRGRRCVPATPSRQRPGSRSPTTS